MMSYRVTDRDHERLLEELDRVRQLRPAKDSGVSALDRWLHRPLRQVR